MQSWKLYMVYTEEKKSLHYLTLNDSVSKIIQDKWIIILTLQLAIMTNLSSVTHLWGTSEKSWKKLYLYMKAKLFLASFFLIPLAGLIKMEWSKLLFISERVCKGFFVHQSSSVGSSHVLYSLKTKGWQPSPAPALSHDVLSSDSMSSTPSTPPVPGSGSCPSEAAHTHRTLCYSPATGGSVGSSLTGEGCLEENILL